MIFFPKFIIFLASLTIHVPIVVKQDEVQTKGQQQVIPQSQNTFPKLKFCPRGSGSQNDKRLNSFSVEVSIELEQDSF